MAGLTRFRLKEIVLGTKQANAPTTTTLQTKVCPSKLTDLHFHEFFFGIYYIIIFKK